MHVKTAGQAASFCAVAELPSTGRRRRWWCHDHVRSQRRSVGMASSLPMLTTTCASIAAARSRVWAHTTTCCDTSLSTSRSSMCRGRKLGEYRPYRSVEGRYVSYINRLSRGMHWFKPETAPDRSVRSARVSRCGLRAADGARGEAWRPLTVSHGVSETGTIDYHHGVIHPGRGAS